MRHQRRLLVLSLACATVLASTATLAVGATRPSSAPGVTSTQVKVGAIVTQSGPLAADFQPYLSGVQAYFDYVNALGGVNGRKLVLAYPLDDMSNGSTDINDAKTLVTVDKAFAIVGVSTPFFNASKYLSTSGVPTFGYATANVWSGPKNFFADYGSELNYASSVPQFAYVAKVLKDTKIALVALKYGPSQAECQPAASKLVSQFHDTIAYSNLNVPLFNANWGVIASNIKGSNANLLISCMDVGSNTSLAQQLEGDGANLAQLWLDGYDRNVLAKNSSVMQGVYLMLQHVPFESGTSYPATFPGMALYLSTMVKYGFNTNYLQYSDVALMGWESANLFAQGLKAAGKNPTRSAVITDINKITKDTGGPKGGVTAPVNWTTAHTKSSPPACETYVQASGTSFKVALFTSSAQHPWICFPWSGTIDLSKPVKPPLGTPGA